MAARSQGREAFYIPTNGFDLTMIRLGLACLTGDQLARVQTIAGQSLKDSDSAPAPFEVESGPLTSVVKTNAFPIQVPNELIQFEAQGFEHQTRLDQLNTLTQDKQIAAGFKGTKILTLGDVEELKTVFNAHLSGEFERIPILSSDLGCRNLFKDLDLFSYPVNLSGDVSGTSCSTLSKC